MTGTSPSTPLSPTSEFMAAEIRRLDGPILVLGASGFVGANLLRAILNIRSDVHGTASRLPAWRLESVPANNIHVVDLLIDSNLDGLLEKVRPKTVFNCVAFGAYSFETDGELIYETNFSFITRLLDRLRSRSISMYVHAGSSSEYGDNCTAPVEDAHLQPNSHYAVSKAAAAHLIHYYGKHLQFPCANLRLYSVYGPLEDSSRLIPNLVRCGLQGKLPEFVRPDISRDFVYVDDVSAAFIQTALQVKKEDYGDSFNIGTARKVTMADIAGIAQKVFNVVEAPQFTMSSRQWDVADWYAQPQKALDSLQWTPKISIEDGLRKTAAWMRTLPDLTAYEQSSRKYLLDTRCSVSAIIACYKDGQAIPVMYQRLKETFKKLQIDHEIIFVNDCSPDDSEETIRRLSQDDPRVIGISHSRNFGSQAAFMSGLRIARKNACVLLDGDLQDPPELIEQFVAKWREGFDVVYGRRVKRDATLFMQLAYKAFYRIFNYFSYVAVPHDAGDFSLLDRKVVQSLTQFPERDLFLRGLRAFAGFKQVGVDYHRPERMFGSSTNNLVKHLGWAKKGILSFSNTPLNMLSVLGGGLLLLTFALAVVQVLLRVYRPDWVPQGITTVLLAIMFFGSLSTFATAVLGEYLAKVFEEVKCRPLYIRRSIVRNGEIRNASSHAAGE
jgi:nucleoside-diphosphate-sugar epimerase/glycosyltransferase involved in cell wall biosynthesis